jgi:release factor glutamine methyltransferase
LTTTYDSLLRDAAAALAAAGIENVRLEARLLLAKAADATTEELISRGADETPAAVAKRLTGYIARRVCREPMAYILGEREFWGLPFKVSPAVLVPRPDSETMIEAALAMLPDRLRLWRFLDLGVGSGCLLLTLLKEYEMAEGMGLELSHDALAIAQANADELGVASRARLCLGDWRQPGWDQRFVGAFDLVVSNPPYVRASDIAGLMPEVAEFEPRVALDGGVDGLDAYRAIVAAAPRLVAPGGHLLVELGDGQVPEIAELFRSAGLTVEGPWNDLAGIERVLGATH